MTRSDVDTVIQTLAGHNAYTISDNIEGDDKFGKLLSFKDFREYKPSGSMSCNRYTLIANYRSYSITPPGVN